MPSALASVPQLRPVVLPWSGKFYYPEYHQFVPAEHFIIGQNGIFGINPFLGTRIAKAGAFESYRRPVFGLRVDGPGLTCPELCGSLWSVSLADLWWAIIDTKFRQHALSKYGTIFFVETGLEDFVVRVETGLHGIVLTGLPLLDQQPVDAGAYLLGAGIGF